MEVLNRLCAWVTVDGSAAAITSRVRSTHRTMQAAQLAARLAGRIAVSAEVVRDMQNGLSFEDASRFYAGKPIEPARVWVST